MQMIFPWIFDEVHALRPFKDAAQLLAEKKDWPSLYDIAALKENKVCRISVKVDKLRYLRLMLFPILVSINLLRIIIYLDVWLLLIIHKLPQL